MKKRLNFVTKFIEFISNCSLTQPTDIRMIHNIVAGVQFLKKLVESSVVEFLSTTVVDNLDALSIMSLKS
jgi:hypothetical protein